MWSYTDGVNGHLAEWNGTFLIKKNLIVNNQAGIGTANPLAPLHVGAGTHVPNSGAPTAVINNVGGGGLSILGADANNQALYLGSATDKAAGEIIMNYNSGLLSVANHKPTGALQFFTGGTGAGNIRIFINSTGNVGIGTANPLSILHVNSAASGALFMSQTSPVNTIPAAAASGALFISSGALYFRGASGTLTKIADP